MSLINDMLRDLDQRQAPAREPAVMMPRVAKPQARSPVVRWLILGALVLVVVLGALAALWLWFEKVPAQSETAVVESAPVQREIESVDMPAKAEPAASVAVQPSAAEPAGASVQPKEQPTLESISQLEPAAQQPMTVTAVEGKSPAPQDSAPVVEQAPIALAEVSSQLVPAPVEPIAEERPAKEKPAEEKPAVAADRVQAVEEDVSVVEEASVVEETPAPVRALEKTRVLTPEQRDQEALMEANRLWQGGQSLEAENLLRLHVAENPGADRSRAQLTQWLIGAGRTAEAEGLLLNVTAASHPDLKKLKARLWQAQGQPQPALELLRENAPAMQSDSGYHVILAALYSQLGLFDDAVNSYAGLVSMNPNQADWWAGLGIALEGDNQIEPARRAYQQATSLSGLHPQLQSYVTSRLQALQR